MVPHQVKHPGEGKEVSRLPVKGPTVFTGSVLKNLSLSDAASHRVLFKRQVPDGRPDGAPPFSVEGFSNSTIYSILEGTYAEIDR